MVIIFGIFNVFQRHCFNFLRYSYVESLSLIGPELPDTLTTSGILDHVMKVICEGEVKNMIRKAVHFTDLTKAKGVIEGFISKFRLHISQFF